MALVVADRVQETSVTSGTGTLTLAGAIAGFQSFSTAIGNGNTTFYTITDTTTYDWEVGIGTVGAGTLARTTVLSNSAGTTSPISFAGNSKFVFCTYPAEKSINYDANGVATIGEVLGYADTGIVGSFTSTVAGYNQVIVQNKSSATNASSNLNVSNDAGTAGNNYAELGINSSTFTGSGSFNIAGAAYVASAGTDLTIGTYNANDIHFVTNSSTVDAMTIHDNGGISLGALLNPGIGNLAAKKLVPGYTAVTSAAGTTVLTADANYYQNLVGSTTQTFQLPDATTLLIGTTFIFDNNSSGNLTVVDNASGSIEIIPGGAAGFIYLANNSTVAGTWNRHSFLPASYDFNSTTANFGTATITSATWNGTTIATGYGGTGLTSFSAANNALYSTSSSALTAGTLPVAAGGSGATTFTANGVLYGNGTSALGVTAAGTTGQVLLANTSGAPTWGAIPTTGAVTSISFGSTGLTPNTATTGVVTVAGTLDITNGGTGQITASAAFNALSPLTTQGDTLYGGASGAGTRLAIGTAGQVLTVNSGATAPQWSTPASNVSSFQTSLSGLTPSTATTGAVTLAGTLGPTSGGTGLTAYTQGDIIYASATNTLSRLAGVATGNALISGGVASDPSWGKIGLTTHVSGTLPTANGGTNLTSFTSGGALYATSTSALTTGTLPIASGGTGQTTASTAFEALSPMTSVGDMIYEAAGPTSARLPIGSTNQVLTVIAGIPSWQTPAAGVTSITGTANQVIASASTGAVTLSTPQSIGTASSVQFGSLGVGTAASGTAGEIRATNNVTAYYSDARLKDFKGTITNALDKVQALNGYYFTENARAKELGYNNDKMQVGVSAQEVEAVLPEVVTEAPISAEYKTVYYDKLVPLLIEAIKELKAEIDELKGK
jgi:hypothetical protein